VLRSGLGHASRRGARAVLLCAIEPEPSAHILYNEAAKEAWGARMQSPDSNNLPSGLRWVYVLVATVLVIVTVAFLFWKWGPRRPQEPGFKFVYVNQDGSARELSPKEREYLSEEFSWADGGRPYVKSTYESLDGYGSKSGFIERRRVPARIKILPVHPGYDVAVKELVEDPLDAERAAGDIIVKNPDGSITDTPNPNLSREARFEILRKHYLEQQRRREVLAAGE
jgi:hypothetical protein